MAEASVKVGLGLSDGGGMGYGRTFAGWLMGSVLAAILAVGGAAPAAADEYVEFEGGGWGHGVGMSQYGARAMAESGRSVEQILGFYYQGSSVTPLSGVFGSEHFLFTDPDPLWVNLIPKVDVVEFTPFGTGDDPFAVCDADQCVDLADGVPWRVEAVDDGCLVGPVTGWPEGAVPMGCALDLDLGDSTVSGLTIPGACPQTTCRYGRGVFHVRRGAHGLHALVEIDIEEYLYGLAEVPSSWPATALQAQAVAGRSYAVRRIHAAGPEADFGTQRQRDCWCHLVDTTSDQAYTGLGKELETSGGTVWGDRWVAAVDATAGKVVTHLQAPPPGIVSTFYSSSNGGWTEAIEDIWGGTPQPYLVSVKDDWSVSAASGNPYASWTTQVPLSTIAARLGWDQVTSAVLLSAAPDAQVRFGGRSGGANVNQQVSGYIVRSWFGLRSGGLRSVKFVGPGGFSDISTSVHVLDIVRIAEADITRGCNPPTNDRFCPDATVTRGQLAAFFVRARSLPAVDGHGFVDAQGHLFSNDIARIAAAGITRGCNPPDNDLFCPDRQVTRGQAAAFFARALDLPPVEGTSFQDTGGSVFAGDIEKLAAAGITKGCNPPANDRFCPERTITRAEFATFLVRAFLP